MCFQHFLDLQLVGEHQYSASLLHAHDTDTRATMNMAVCNDVIAAGQDGTCCLMTFKLHGQKDGQNAPKQGGLSPVLTLWFYKETETRVTALLYCCKTY